MTAYSTFSGIFLIVQNTIREKRKESELQGIKERDKEKNPVSSDTLRYNILTTS